MHSCWTENKRFEDGGECRDVGKYTFRGVLETKITDGTKQFWFQEEIPKKNCEMNERQKCVRDIPEASRVNTRKVLFLLVVIVASARGSSGNTDTIGDNVALILVVNEFLVIVGHVKL